MRDTKNQRDCIKDVCQEKPGSSLVLLLHNTDPSVISNAGIGSSGHGYEGLSKCIAIEIDLSKDVGLKYNKAHISVEYNDNGVLNAQHQYSLGLEHIRENIADGKPHKLKVIYERKGISAKKGPKSTFQVFCLKYKKIVDDNYE